MARRPKLKKKQPINAQQKTISFYPGPSKIYDRIPKYVIDGYRKRIFSVNHRSPEFQDLYQKTSAIFKKRLNVPDDYSLFFASSATECWEIIAQSLIKKGSYHFYNGAFGKKWFQQTTALGCRSKSLEFDINSEIPVSEAEIGQEDFICVTQNETSNGTQVSSRKIEELKSLFPEKFIAADATSSMAGVRMPWNSADFWYASVQKCFGLPSGMAVIVASNRLIEYALQNDDSVHYNRFSSIVENGRKWQTTHTPNILDIYLLYRSLQDAPKIKNTEDKLLKRKSRIEAAIKAIDSLDFLVENQNTRSHTVLTVKAENEVIETVNEKAREKGLIFGNGYGEWKSNTFRLANFPALRDSEIDKLINFFDTLSFN
ncbi:MAG: aminotransferase class V-fold PLP-dependent enzyme [Bacteroidota bacterium]